MGSEYSKDRVIFIVRFIQINQRGVGGSVGGSVYRSQNHSYS